MPPIPTKRTTPVSVVSCLHDQLDTHYSGELKGVACHQGTFCFFYLAIYGELPSVDQLNDAPTFVANLLNSPSKTLLQQSKKTFKPEHLKIRETGTLVKPGSAIIFCKNTERLAAAHSCVAQKSSELAGYNQKGWYEKGGEEGKWSVHGTDQINWTPEDKTLARWGSGLGADYKLFAIPEAEARIVLEAIVG
jgi:hypothetical protein